MPGFLLHFGATIQCAHGGPATPSAPNPRALVSDQPIVTIASPYVIAVCPFPPASGGPCATAQYVTAATRVQSMGQPVLLLDSQAICSPTGTPLVPKMTQVRVTGM